MKIKPSTQIISRLILFAFFALTINSTYAQGSKWLSWRANNKIGAQSFKKAKALYKRAITKDSLNYNANIGLAKLYLYEYELYDSAFVYFSSSLEIRKKDPNYIDYFDYARCLQLLERPKEAIENYNLFREQFIEKKFVENENILQFNLDENIKHCENAAQQINAMNHIISVKNMDFYINSTDSEYTPVFIDRDSIIIYNARYQDNKKEQQFIDNKFMENVYSFNLKESVSSTYDTETKQDFHHAIVGQLPDSDSILIFMKNGLWFTSLKGRKLSNPTPLPAEISDFYFQPHGVFSANKDTLIFSAKKNINDDLDIYITFREENKWSFPTKIGPGINTTYDEDSPFLSKNGKTLYFSSKGHNSSGGYDVYRSYLMENGIWSDAINLGYPINSAGHDIYFSMNNNGKNGFISSNRTGGFGLMDIYEIDFDPKPKFDCIEYVSLDSFEFEQITTEIDLVVGKKIQLNASQFTIEQHELINYNWKIQDSIIGNQPAVIDYTFDSEGKYDIIVQVDGLNQNNELKEFCFKSSVQIVSEEIYADQGNSTENTIQNNENDNKIENETISQDSLVAILENITVLEKTFSPVYFGFDRNYLDFKARSNLDNIISYLTNNKNVKVIISGHTDSKGSDAYNYNLAKKRIESTIKYLKKYGIDSNRIVQTVNQGESEPDAPNKLSNGKDNSAGRKLNRRVAFKFIQ